MNVNELQDFIGVEKALLLSGEEKKLPVNGSLELLPVLYNFDDSYLLRSRFRTVSR